jgi:hypothetical protein
MKEMLLTIPTKLMPIPDVVTDGRWGKLIENEKNRRKLTCEEV